MNKTRVFTFLLFTGFSAILSAGNSGDTVSHRPGLPSIGAGMGVMSYHGRVGNASHAQVGSFTDIRPGFYFGIKERLGDFMEIELSGTFGKLSGNDYKTDNLNFETKVSQFGLGLILPFDNGLIMKKGAGIVPYVSAGIAYMSYRPFTDSLSKDGSPYFYWSDGSIRNKPEGFPGSSRLSRDYKYETPLSAAKSTVLVPLGIGLNFNLTADMAANLGVVYNLTFSKNVDAAPDASKNDTYVFTHVGLAYRFGKSKNSEKDYDNVDWSGIDNADSDNDGIPDLSDNCPGTPSGVQVDAKGCPVDTDGDGVPDYLDEEKNTKPGSKVDEHGVRLDFKKIAANQKQIARWDSISDSRSRAFNAAPSLEKLKEFERMWGSGPAKTNGKNKPPPPPVPADFRPLDKDGDGVISVKELNNAIDSFFSGENTLTVDQINKLIDFFFEQQ